MDARLNTPLKEKRKVDLQTAIISWLHQTPQLTHSHSSWVEWLQLEGTGAQLSGPHIADGR